MPSSRLLLLACIALILFDNACGGYSSSNSSSCFVNTLNVSPPSATADHNMAPPGNSQQFMAFGGQTSNANCAYTQATLTTVSWTVSDTTNATIGNTMTGNAQTNNYGLATCLHSAATPITVTAVLPAGQNSGHTASGTAILTCK